MTPYNHPIRGNQRIRQVPTSFIAFVWPTVSENCFPVDDINGRDCGVLAYEPLCFQNIFTPKKVKVDLNHDFVVEKLTASIWHTDFGLMGQIKLPDTRTAAWMVNAFNGGTFGAVSPTSTILESHQEALDDGTDVTVIERAEIKSIALCKRSANTHNLCMAWIQDIEFSEPGYLYNRHLPLDLFSMYYDSFNADLARMSDAYLTRLRKD